MRTPDPTIRDIPFDPPCSALLFIDVQNVSVHRNGAEFAGLSDADVSDRFGFFLERMENETIANMQALQRGFRAAKMEILYTRISVHCAVLANRSIGRPFLAAYVMRST